MELAFSDKAKIVYEQVLARLRNRWPRLGPVTESQIAQAALQSSFVVSIDNDSAQSSIILSCAHGQMRIERKRNCSTPGTWTCQAELDVSADGRFLYFRHYFDLGLLIDYESIVDGGAEAMANAIQRFTKALANVHSPELALAKIKLDEPLEQEHTAKGEVWFLKRELHEC